MTKQTLKPSVGDVLIIDRVFTGRVARDGNKESRKVRREETAITAVYEDGRVSTRTGDVFTVKPYRAATTRKRKDKNGYRYTQYLPAQFISLG